MRRGYIRIRKHGPDEATQRQSLIAAGVDVSDRLGCVYVDGKTEPDPADPLPQRTWAIRHLRSDDELVVHDPGTLGRSADDIIGVIAAIGRRGASVVVASTDQTYHWHPDAADIAAFAKTGSDMVRHENTSRARKRAAELGLRGGRPDKLADAVVYKRALELWSDPEVKSAKEVIAVLLKEFKVKVSVRTLYNRLPSRSDAIDGRTVERRSPISTTAVRRMFMGQDHADG